MIEATATPIAAQPAEEAIACVVDAVCRHPRHRELLYKTLAFCREERDELEAERFIGQQPECTQALQEPFALVRQLVACGGLERTAYDADGQLLECWAQEGRKPKDAILRNLSFDLAIEPKRRDAFIRLLEHCREPRSLDSVKQLLDGHPALEPSARSSGQRLHAAYFIDRLDEAGGLVWNGAWVTTEAGERFLATV